jgi:hypothetical protein
MTLVMTICHSGDRNGLDPFCRMVNANGQADVVQALIVSGNDHTGVGVQAFIGRTLAGSDDQPAPSPTAALSYRYWQRR